MKSATLQALHSSASPEHGTPPQVIEAARKVLGTIDLDPASSAVFNELVQAKRFYTEADDGLDLNWLGNIFLNPPGEPTGQLIKEFWGRLVYEYDLDNVKSAIWIGFSIDQLQTLQNVCDTNPLDFPICVPRKRLQFVKSLKVRQQTDLFLGATEADVGKQPTKPNFICYLPPRHEVGRANDKLRFRAEFEQFGAVKI